MCAGANKGLCRLVAVLILSSSAILSGQAAGAWFGVRPTRSFRVEAGDAFGLYGPLATIELSATILNETDRILLLQPGFFQAIAWELSPASSQPVSAVRADWEPNASCGASERCSLDAQVSLPAKSAVEAVVMLQFSRPIALGKHRLLMNLKAARTLAREADGSPWIGGLLERGSIDLDIRPVVSSQDRARFRRAEAFRALTRKDYEDAARQFQLMTVADPHSVEAFAGLGNALMQLGRFSGAVRAFEQAIERAAGITGSSLLPRDLALAYMAAGREPDAEQVLRRYHSPDQVQQLLQQIREAAKRLQNRR